MARRADPRPAKPVVALASPEARLAAAKGFAGVKLTNVAPQVGLDFRQGAFRYGVTHDPPAMMGGGVCWLDYDNDGWLDLFVVNSYGEGDIGAVRARTAASATALFHNDHGSSPTSPRRRTRAAPSAARAASPPTSTATATPTSSSPPRRATSCSGTTATARSPKAHAPPAIVSFGWHSGATIGDVNGDGRPDLFVAGYTEPHGAIPGSSAGFPTNHLGVRDELFLNEGNGPDGRARFREVGAQAGLDPKPYDHSLGAMFTDLNGDGRPDLYVANDEDPNRYTSTSPAARSASASSTARRARASPTGTPAWASPRATSTATGGRTCSSATHAARATRSTAARGTGLRERAPAFATRVRRRTTPAGATPGST